MNRLNDVKKKLRSYVKQRPLLEIFFQIYIHRKDKPWIEELCRIPADPYFVRIKQNDNGEMEKGILCAVTAGGENDGFFASVRWLLDGLYFCDRFGFYPAASFSDKSLYKSRLFPEDVNVFDYFFNPVSEYSMEDISRHVCAVYEPRNRMLAESMNRDVGYQISHNYIQEMSEIMKKYLSFREDVTEYAEKQMKKAGISDDVLGVHARGTDFRNNYAGHPVYIQPERYFEEIDKAFLEHKYKKIFLATDDKVILKSFIKKYG